MQLNERAYAHIRTQLVSGDLGPGDRLVTRKLAEEIGVSLGPVREAIQRLATEGLVRQTPGAGAVVHQPSLQEIEDLYVLRDALESCAAGLAAQYVSPAMLDQMESLFEIMQDIATSINESARPHATKSQMNHWLDAEEQFHEILLEASKNKLLEKVAREHRAIAKIFNKQRERPELLTKEVATLTIQWRRELLDALQQGDAERARSLLSKHIQGGQKLILQHFRSK